MWFLALIFLVIGVSLMLLGAHLKPSGRLKMNWSIPSAKPWSAPYSLLPAGIITVMFGVFIIIHPINSSIASVILWTGISVAILILISDLPGFVEWKEALFKKLKRKPKNSSTTLARTKRVT